MADEYPWCRWYNEVIGDPKLEHVARRSNVPFITVLGAWGMILAMASRSPQRGSLMLSDTFPYEHRDILDKLGIPEANEILDAFFGLGLLEQDEEGVIVISHWEKRQPSSDNSAQRQREHRARKQQEGKTTTRQPNNSVTTMSRDTVVTVTPSDIDTETDQYTQPARVREDEPDLPPEPDSQWGDDLAEDLGEVVDAAAPEGESYAAAYKRLKSEQGFEGFPAVRTQRDVKLLPLINTRAVYTWVSVTFHAPEYDQLPYLVKQLGDNPNREVLLAVWEMWRGNDYSPGKIIGVMEWYQLRLKDPNWQPTYGQKARASPKTNGVYKGKSKANGKADFDPTTIGQSL